MRIVCTILIFTSFACSAQLSQRIDSLFQSYYKLGLFEGSVLIADSSGVVYHDAFGIANHAHGTPNDTATVFRLGSLEKQFTAMLTLQLVERGKLNLHGKISDYLREYRKDTGSKVTLEHLLTHVSGIPNYTALPGIWNDSMQLSYSSNYILRHFCSGELEFEPGTRYKYNNSGYFILAKIIERVTGKSLSVVLKEMILSPTGMMHTGLGDNLASLQRNARGYYRLGNTYINEPYIFVPNVLGAASMFSTTHDLYLWDRTLYTDKLLSLKYLKQYASPHFEVDPEFSYGYGWEFTQTGVSNGDTIATMEHSGAIRAFRSVIFRVPAEKKCVIMLSNCANQSAYELFVNVMRLFDGIALIQPNHLLADKLYAIMQATSVEDVALNYRALKTEEPANYDYSSSSLELLGERLMLLRNFTWAAAVFQLAVEEYPDYTYGYYYLGKAYEQVGKRDEAIQSYHEAIRRDKNSRPAIESAFQIKHLREIK